MSANIWGLRAEIFRLVVRLCGRSEFVCGRIIATFRRLGLFRRNERQTETESGSSLKTAQEARARDVRLATLFGHH